MTLHWSLVVGQCSLLVAYNVTSPCDPTPDTGAFVLNRRSMAHGSVTRKARGAGMSTWLINRTLLRSGETNLSPFFVFSLSFVLKSQVSSSVTPNSPFLG